MVSDLFKVTNRNVFGDSWTVPAYAVLHPHCVDCSGEEEPFACTGMKLQIAELSCLSLFHTTGKFKVCTVRGYCLHSISSLLYY